MIDQSLTRKINLRMLLKLLFKIGKDLLLFSWVFILSATIITIQYSFNYLKKMFDLPVDVIVAIKETRKNEDNDQAV